MRHLGVAFFVIACFVIVACLVTSPKNADTAPAKARTEISKQSEQPLKLKVFRKSVATDRQRSDLENEVNEWLKENSGKIEVIDQGVVYNGDFIVVVAVWYKLKAE